MAIRQKIGQLIRAAFAGRIVSEKEIISFLRVALPQEEMQPNPKNTNGSPQWVNTAHWAMLDGTPLTEKKVLEQAFSAIENVKGIFFTPNQKKAVLNKIEENRNGRNDDCWCFPGTRLGLKKGTWAIFR